ncbi:hypothetical protein M413DRAFT_178635 [Hebeloma cylindrosporum]|uniref:Uncharacterized protein n=1 Tax=Hebeloma cylindrosporum TaxID=76867 RepID=A0A0C3BUP7_HEBCY|nr:hypothetical protein M413DRAFT_178635 [Hebeloma cylindrosporum h7]
MLSPGVPAAALHALDVPFLQASAAAGNTPYLPRQHIFQWFLLSSACGVGSPLQGRPRILNRLHRRRRRLSSTTILPVFAVSWCECL